MSNAGSAVLAVALIFAAAGVVYYMSSKPE
jgi:hypothetical protein